MVKGTDVFPGVPNPEAKVKEVKSWLNSKGVRDFEPVSLFCDQLGKDTVKEIEALADSLTASKQPGGFKKAIVKGIPRQAVLKPSHAVYRLQNQHFALGDRVTMVQDSGGVPLSCKGVVIGMNSKSMDVVWDAPFMSGTTLGDRFVRSMFSFHSRPHGYTRCSQYRGSAVEFWSCLNLTNPQFQASTNPKNPHVQKPHAPFKPRPGPYPSVQPGPGMQPIAGFRPAATTCVVWFHFVLSYHLPLTPFLVSRQGVHNGLGHTGPVQIMANPNRGRGGAVRGGGPGAHKAPPTATASSDVDSANDNGTKADASAPGPNGNHVPPQRGRGAPFQRGGFRGQRGFAPPFRGRGGFGGPGGERGGFRGRGGRGHVATS